MPFYKVKGRTRYRNTEALDSGLVSVSDSESNQGPEIVSDSESVSYLRLMQSQTRNRDSKMGTRETLLQTLNGRRNTVILNHMLPSTTIAIPKTYTKQTSVHFWVGWLVESLTDIKSFFPWPKVKMIQYNEMPQGLQPPPPQYYQEETL